MTELPWLQLVAEALHRVRKPLAYVLVVGAFALRFSPWSRALDITLVALGLVLLPVLFEIHKKVMSAHEPTIFDTFDSAIPVLSREIDEMAEKHGSHTFRYLGLALVYWRHLEPCLEKLLRRSHVPKLDVQILILDPNWSGLDSLNPVWKSEINASAGWVDNFLLANKAAIQAHGWSITKRHYKGTPHLWGMLIDDSTLFACTTYWENGRMRGGHNPSEVIKRDDERYGDVRIREFVGWFDTLWNQGAADAAPNEGIQRSGTQVVGCS
jgi:hypothetical protein